MRNNSVKLISLAEKSEMQAFADSVLNIESSENELLSEDDRTTNSDQDELESKNLQTLQKSKIKKKFTNLNNRSLENQLLPKSKEPQSLNSSTFNTQEEKQHKQFLKERKLK